MTLIENLKRIQEEKGLSDDALWDILTALRGPDDESAAPKRATTAVIRYKLLGPPPGQSWAQPGEGYIHGALVGPDDAWSAEKRKEMEAAVAKTGRPVGGAHFHYHARHAFRALGLKWDEVNP